MYLPLEIRIKVYKELYSGCRLGVTMIQKGSRIAIEEWISPKNVSFLRVSSQIYDEALPILGNMSTLWLEFENIWLKDSFDIGQILLTSRYAPNLLRSVTPFIKTIDYWDMAAASGFASFASLEEMRIKPHVRYWELDVEGFRKDFFTACDWEASVMTRLGGFIDRRLHPLAEIRREANGRFKVYLEIRFSLWTEDLLFYIGEIVSPHCHRPRLIDAK
jgi:hypothetical protein